MKIRFNKKFKKTRPKPDVEEGYERQDKKTKFNK
jgi:hypothetical protein